VARVVTTPLGAVEYMQGAVNAKSKSSSIWSGQNRARRAANLGFSSGFHAATTVTGAHEHEGDDRVSVVIVILDMSWERCPVRLPPVVVAPLSCRSSGLRPLPPRGGVK
jgi:hypothetical protein